MSDESVIVITGMILTAIPTIGSAVAACILAWRASERAGQALASAEKTGVQVDGRMTELLDVTRTSARAAGRLEGPEPPRQPPPMPPQGH